MNRCRTSLGILVCLVVLCSISLGFLRFHCMTMVQDIDALTDAVASGNPVQIQDACAVLEHSWESFHTAARVFGDSRKTDAMQEILAELPPMLQTSHTLTLPELARLRFLVQEFYTEEIPWLHNIF